jgi:hypothetical protein
MGPRIDALMARALLIGDVLPVPVVAGTVGGNMLWTITILLALLWLIGMVSNHTFGGFIHLLLLLAIVSVLVRVIQGRRPV